MSYVANVSYRLFYLMLLRLIIIHLSQYSSEYKLIIYYTLRICDPLMLVLDHTSMHNSFLYLAVYV